MNFLRKRLVWGIILTVIAALGLAGCGESGQSGQTITVIERHYTSEPDLDGGTQCWFGTPNAYNFYAPNVTHPEEFPVGHEYYGTTHISDRGYVSFNISGIPSGTTIKSATLRLYEIQSNYSTDLYVKLGNLLVDHVDYGTAFSNAQTIYTTPTLNTANTPISTSSNTGWKELAVTAMVQDDISSNRIHSQYRIRFANETLAGSDYSGVFTWICTGENATYKPELVITY